MVTCVSVLHWGGGVQELGSDAYIYVKMHYQIN